jgi:hypothetical protein
MGANPAVVIDANERPLWVGFQSLANALANDEVAPQAPVVSGACKGSDRPVPVIRRITENLLTSQNNHWMRPWMRCTGKAREGNTRTCSRSFGTVNAVSVEEHTASIIASNESILAAV